VILKAAVDLPDACIGRVVLTPETFAKLGAAEIYPSGKRWRFVWSQPLRGDRPWTATAGG
jgi:competence protein ComEC